MFDKVKFDYEKYIFRSMLFTVSLSIVLLPVLIVFYVYTFIDSELIFKNYLFHEIAIGISVLWSLFIAYIAYQCYKETSEVFLRYMVLGFLGESVVYLMHGVLTRTADFLPVLFILFGPVSRVIMAVFLLAAIFRFGSQISDRVDKKNWLLWFSFFLFLIPVTAGIVLLPVRQIQLIRLGLEYASIVFYLAAFLIFFIKRINTPLMWLYAASMVFFAISSFAFTLVDRPWNHMFWLSHLIFAVGFFVLSYSLIKARRHSSSFSEIFKEDLLYEELAEKVKSLKEAKEEAERANNFKSEFLSRMSHELRTPLNAILGFGQLLEMDERNIKDKQREVVGHILEGGQHLLNLVNEILDLAKLDAGKIHLNIQSQSLDAVIQSSLVLTNSLSEKYDVKLEPPSLTGFQILADEQRLKQVFVNLLSNAMKYNKKGGTVRIEITHPEDEFVRVSVIDSGIGMKDADQIQLFEPFMRGTVMHEEVEGTGIGLSITKKLVELMGGRMGVRSVYGKGSTFWFELPYAGSG